MPEAQPQTAETGGAEVTVYVDNSRIQATVGRHTSHWSHLTADDVEELHRFAEALGLRRSYFQTCKANRAMCPPATCPHWHYDVTAGKREQALRMGAQPMDIRQWGDIIARRRAATAAAATSALVVPLPEPAPPAEQPTHRRPPGRGLGLRGPACRERDELDQRGGLRPPRQAMCVSCGRVTPRRDTDRMPWCGGELRPQSGPAGPTRPPASTSSCEAPDGSSAAPAAVAAAYELESPPPPTRPAT